jgi:hypothetical protein
MGLPVSQDHTDTTALGIRDDFWLNGLVGDTLAAQVTGKSEDWVAGVNTGIIAPPHDLFIPISVLPLTKPTT